MHFSVLIPLFSIISASVAAPPLLPPATLSQLLIDLKTNLSDSRPLAPLIPIPSSIADPPIAPPNNTLNLAGHPSDEYSVPGTSITLKIGYWDDRDIDREEMGMTIREIQYHLIQHVRSHGNGPLLAYNEDPFRWAREGFYFIAKSTPMPVVEESILTYRWLLEALVGLYDVLYIAEKPWGAYTTIEHKDLGVLGTAVVLPEPPFLQREVATP